MQDSVELTAQKVVDITWTFNTFTPLIFNYVWDTRLAALIEMFGFFNLQSEQKLKSHFQLHNIYYSYALACTVSVIDNIKYHTLGCTASVISNQPKRYDTRGTIKQYYRYKHKSETEQTEIMSLDNINQYPQNRKKFNYFTTPCIQISHMR